jgi:hypothetical protein
MHIARAAALDSRPPPNPPWPLVALLGALTKQASLLRRCDPHAAVADGPMLPQRRQPSDPTRRAVLRRRRHELIWAAPNHTTDYYGRLAGRGRRVARRAAPCRRLTRGKRTWPATNAPSPILAPQEASHVGCKGRAVASSLLLRAEPRAWHLAHTPSSKPAFPRSASRRSATADGRTAGPWEGPPNDPSHRSSVTGLARHRCRSRRMMVHSVRLVGRSARWRPRRRRSP